MACRPDLPPTRGGYGANTGIHDAHDLAWRRHQQTFARPDYKPHSNGIADDEPILEEEAMEFGQLYRSAAVLGAGEELPPARPDEWAGQPGTRAPHVWGTSGAARVSTLDLFQRSWVLLAEDDRWREAARQASETPGVTLEFVRVGVDFVPATPVAFRAAFGVCETGASLVRPDGYIAWRSKTLPPEPLDARRGARTGVVRGANVLDPEIASDGRGYRRLSTAIDWQVGRPRSARVRRWNQGRIELARA